MQLQRKRRASSGRPTPRLGARRGRAALRLLVLSLLAASAGSCADGSRAPTPRTAAGTTDVSAVPGDSRTPDPEPGSTSPATDDAAPSPSRAQLAVILVIEGDVLNARSAAGIEHPVIGELPPHATGLLPTGNAAPAGGQRWLEVSLPRRGSGWVNSYFTTEYVDRAEFCDDARIRPLLADLRAAVRARDGPALAARVSPHHGLVLRRHWWNPEVRYTAAEVSSIFTADASRDWGTADGTGFPITGSFNDVALPLFDRLYAGTVTLQCNDIDDGSGSSAGYRIWPFEYANINYYALYRAASPDQELDWNTWAVGIEYVDADPYIAFLVHYQWEI